MKRLSAHLKQALSALAAADAGEMLTLRQMDRVLQRPDSSPLPHRRQVALWAAATPSRETLDYALSTCKRLDAGLVYLHDENTDTSWLHERLRNMPVEAVTLSGRPEDALRAYLAAHSQVAFLVLDGTDTGSENLSLRTGNLGVPVVLVASPKPAKPAARVAAKAAAPASPPVPLKAAPVAALG